MNMKIKRDYLFILLILIGFASGYLFHDLVKKGDNQHSLVNSLEHEEVDFSSFGEVLNSFLFKRDFSIYGYVNSVSLKAITVFDHDPQGNVHILSVPISEQTVFTSHGYSQESEVEEKNISIEDIRRGDSVFVKIGLDQDFNMEAEMVRISQVF